MDIKWYTKKKRIENVTINKNSIILNRESSKHFDDYSHVRLGIIHEDKIVVILPISNNDIEAGKYRNSRISLSFARSYTRISCTDFIRNLNTEFSLSLTNPRKFKSEWDYTENVFKIYLKEEL